MREVVSGMVLWNIIDSMRKGIHFEYLSSVWLNIIISWLEDNPISVNCRYEYNARINVK